MQQFVFQSAFHALNDLFVPCSSHQIEEKDNTAAAKVRKIYKHGLKS
jgi:hypothetical protein